MQNSPRQGGQTASKIAEHSRLAASLAGGAVTADSGGFWLAEVYRGLLGEVGPLNAMARTPRTLSAQLLAGFTGVLQDK